MLKKRLRYPTSAKCNNGRAPLQITHFQGNIWLTSSVESHEVGWWSWNPLPDVSGLQIPATSASMVKNYGNCNIITARGPQISHSRPGSGFRNLISPHALQANFVKLANPQPVDHLISLWHQMRISGVCLAGAYQMTGSEKIFWEGALSASI